MKARWVVFLLVLALAVSGIVYAADYKCIGDRIELRPPFGSWVKTENFKLGGGSDILSVNF